MVPGTGQAPNSEQLQDLLLESPDFTEFLLGLTTISASRLGGQEPMLCAITVERNGSPATVASSEPEALRMDEKQYDVDDGPCLTALRRQHTVVVPDLGRDSRWQRYAGSGFRRGDPLRPGSSHWDRPGVGRGTELLRARARCVRRGHYRCYRRARRFHFAHPAAGITCASAGDLPGRPPVSPQIEGGHRRCRFADHGPEPLQPR